jgi:hypothetical protein
MKKEYLSSQGEETHTKKGARVPKVEESYYLCHHILSDRFKKRLSRRDTDERFHLSDEGINTSATIIPSVEIIGPITWSRAQQLNHQVNSILCSSAYNIESRLLSNDLIVLRNQGEDRQIEYQEGAGEPRRRAWEGGNQSNLELPSSSPTRSLGPHHIQIDVQIAYDLRFGRSTYARKDKEVIVPMTLVSCVTKIGVVRNHQNSTDLQNHFSSYATILAWWAMYRVGVHLGRILGFGHNPRPFIFSSHCHFMRGLLRLIYQEQFCRHSVCKTPSFMS